MMVGQGIEKWIMIISQGGFGMRVKVCARGIG